MAQIDCDELFDYLKFLGFKCVMRDVEDMIWEVDEVRCTPAAPAAASEATTHASNLHTLPCVQDCDRCVSWDEFKTLFYRVRHDKTGWEPRRLFNVVEFVMHDKDCSGTIDMDECMEILFRRFGKDQLEERTNEFFTHDINGDNTISFMEFQKQMNTIRPKRRDPRALAATHGGKPTGSSFSLKSSSTSAAGRR